MKFYSHAKKIDDQIVPTKELNVHLENTFENMWSKFHQHINFSSYDKIDWELLLKILGLTHDLGKFTIFFQDYLLKEDNSCGLLKNHSLISSIITFNLTKQYNPKLAVLLMCCVLRHHGSLINIDEEKNESTLQLEYTNFETQIENIKDNSQAIISKFLKSKFEDMYLKTPIFEWINKKYKGRIVYELIVKNKNIENYFLLIYLFSLLISSDKIEAGNVNDFSVSEIPGDIVKKYLFSKPKQNINNLRNKANLIIAQKLESIEVISKLSKLDVI